MATKISNCGSNENGKTTGGKAGDQTGKEYRVISWYSRPWKCVLRYSDPKVGEEIARISEAAAKNDNIGYCQTHRRTYHDALKAANWNPAAIKTPVEADCSASTLANIIAAGHKCGIAALKQVNPDGYTGNMRAALKKAGFTVLTDSKYLSSSDYLLPGDILLNDNAHAAVNLTAGPKAVPSTSGKNEPDAAYKVGRNYTLQANMYIRKTPNGEKLSFSALTADGKANGYADGAGKAILKKGTVVTCNGLEKAAGGAIWVKIPSGYVCGISGSGKIYIK